MSEIDIEKLRQQYQQPMQAVLRELLVRAPGMLAAQVCTSDGFEVASMQRTPESHRRLAAMASSLHALGIAVASEAELGTYVNLSVETTDGQCLVMAIPGSHDRLLLMAIASSSMLLGRFQQTCRAACAQLGGLVQL